VDPKLLGSRLITGLKKQRLFGSKVDDQSGKVGLLPPNNNIASGHRASQRGEFSAPELRLECTS
jgi:hypothetical protein